MLLNCGVGEDLRVPWTARRSNQSILKEIKPEYSLEGLMLRIKLQYFGHLMHRDDSLKKSLMLGKSEGKGKMGQQRMRWLNGVIVSIDMSLSKLQEIVKDREACHAVVRGFMKSHTWLSNWTTSAMYYSLVPVVAYVRTPFLLKADYYSIVCIYCCVVLVTQLCPTPVTPQTANRQAPLSMEFSRQEYWSGLPFPSPCIYCVLFICLSLWQCRKLLFKINLSVGNLPISLSLLPKRAWKNKGVKIIFFCVLLPCHFALVAE